MNVKRLIYCVLGLISVALGALGAAIPILPTVPFLMFAAFCFGKSSVRLKDWFARTKLYQNHLASFVKGEGMTRKTKIRIMLIVTITMGIGFAVMGSVPVGRMILTAIWIGHLVYFLLVVRTRKEYS